MPFFFFNLMSIINYFKLQEEKENKKGALIKKKAP
jgi:hypothetical protein